MAIIFSLNIVRLVYSPSSQNFIITIIVKICLESNSHKSNRNRNKFKDFNYHRRNINVSYSRAWSYNINIAVTKTLNGTINYQYYSGSTYGPMTKEKFSQWNSFECVKFSPYDVSEGCSAKTQYKIQATSVPIHFLCVDTFVSKY